MAENSKISWTTHTFNPWRGCTKISAGCTNCYAETMSWRNPKVLGVWGPRGTRVVASEAQWKEPLKWNKAAAQAGERPRVFCASLADVFEDWRGVMKDARGEQLFHPHDSWNARSPWIRDSDCGGGEPPVTMDDVRARLLTLIHQTPNLDWLLLTKRADGIRPTLERLAKRNDDAGDLAKQWVYGSPMPNVWLGTSVEDQAAKGRIDHLRNIPAAIRFLSVEPLLEDLGAVDFTGIHWCIIGGESGPGARPMQLEWARSIIQQCEDATVKVFVKQDSGPKPGQRGTIPLDVWQHKEFPEVLT